MALARRAPRAGAEASGEVAGLATCIVCFYIGQRILQSNGFTYENGYPGETLADGTTFRAVFGTAVYLAALAMLAIGVGTLLRHTAAAITVVLALVLGPVIAIGFLPEHLAERVEQGSLMAAGPRDPADSRARRQHPARPLARIRRGRDYAVVALALAFWAISRRDA